MIESGSNFKFLEAKLPDLACIASLAEQYVYADPDSCAVKLRLYAEKLTKLAYQALSITVPESNRFLDLLKASSFEEKIPKTVLNVLHMLRRIGNAGAHQGTVSSDDAKKAIREAFDLGGWMYISYMGGKSEDIEAFQEIKQPGDSKDWEKEQHQIKQQLAEKEARIDELLQELEAKRAGIDQSADQETLVQRGYQTADALNFDETTTRKRLIDYELAHAGWDVCNTGKSTDAVEQEVEIADQPTASGIGYADYVLWGDDGKPLAVIEAKKTAVDPRQGRKQAQLYADGLEKQFGQRPFVFYTNGYDIYILNDAAGEPERKIYGFYAKTSLQYLLFQRSQQIDFRKIQHAPKIVDRLYQIEAIKRVTERFQNKHRKSLLVMATGTGKTRVAVAICDILLQANWAKRILFLCDRRELRRQAKNAFKEYIQAPIVTLNSRTAQDRENRIYMATYPAMKKVFDTFDVGFFDLIIADESHRSIYNTYGDIFLYFDALQIGLTATPVDYIQRNTFRLFDCQEQDATFSYSYQEAINNQPPWLSRFEVYLHTTAFQRDGIRYSEMTPEQRLELEEQAADAEDFDFAARDLDRLIINKDTNREILRNLMETGLQDPTGSHPGKTIIFARSHNHALVMEKLFKEMYPQYGNDFCQVIDTYNPRAEQLIDDFKDIANPLTIAISVDMLDTGVDIPEVVNLVFAKPLKSYVKFWQMIGRGTRLCKDLFGPGQDKEVFYIFDHWGNFEWFDEQYKKAEPSRKKSLLQRLFEQRLKLADAALAVHDQDSFALAADLLEKDVRSIKHTNSIAIKEKWRQVLLASREGLVRQYAATTRQLLLNEIAPLMGQRNIRGHKAAHAFDLLMTTLQISLLQNSADFSDGKDELLSWMNNLAATLNEVREKSVLLNQLKTAEYWESISVAALETVRLELRGIAHLTQKSATVVYSPRIVDVPEVREEIQHYEYTAKASGLDMARYRERVEKILRPLFNSDPTLQKIRSGQAVEGAEIEKLVSMVLVQHPDINLQILEDHYPETRGRLYLAIRRVVGLAPEFVDRHFSDFVENTPALSAAQVKFLDMLKNHVIKYGGIQPEKLYEAPFTYIDSAGLSGVFSEQQQIEQLLDKVEAINN